jgi:hypothetical protein
MPAIDIADWLRKLGLERYEAAFCDNEIDCEALPKLTAEDLKDLGVVLGTHRHRLLDAIMALRTEAPTADLAVVLPDHDRQRLPATGSEVIGRTAQKRWAAGATLN